MRRERAHTHPGAGAPRPARRIHREAKSRLRQPALCPVCAATYLAGRWTWNTAPTGAYEHACPACERIASGDPAGELRIEGQFAEEHRSELEHLLRNIEERERTGHPLKRIMAITEHAAGLTVTTTDASLAATFGRALESAYAGKLDLPPTTSDVENLVRVRWSRD